MQRALRGLTLDVERGRLVPGLVWGGFVYGFHKYGALSGWYLAFPWFQNVTHAASASGVALLVGLVGLQFGYRGRRLLALVVGLTALGALGWEAIEYMGLLDSYGVYLHFHDFGDAAVDMASNAVGTALALVALRAWTGLEPVGRDPSGGPAGTAVGSGEGGAVGSGDEAPPASADRGDS